MTRVSDARLRQAARRIEAAGQIPTGGKIGAAVGMTAAGVNWRIARMIRDGSWTFARDVRAGHPYYGNGYEARA
jgi:hypothetical protein